MDSDLQGTGAHRADLRGGRYRLDALFRADPLTPREAEVMRLLAQGHSRRDLAVTLGVSTNTVKYHLRNIYAKLGAECRGQALQTYERQYTAAVLKSIHATASAAAAV